MKAMEFLTLLGELDEAAAAPVPQKKKRRALWMAVAASLCVCLMAFSAWFFIPPMGVQTQELRLTTVRIGHRLASYRVVKTEGMSRFERVLLPRTPGEAVCVHGDTTFYRIKGAEDLIYLLGEADGQYTLYEFEHFISLVGVDMRQSYWFDAGWLTEEDVDALDCETQHNMGEILDTVYRVTSGGDLKRIRMGKSSSHGGGVGKKVTVPTVTVKDGETLERLYRLVSSMTPTEVGQTMDFGGAEAHDESYLNGEVPLSAQTDRRMVLTLEGGYEIAIHYYPTTGLLYQPRSNQYVYLSDADNEWLISLAEIDMEWRDWGTEKPLDYGDGCETAVSPPVPDAE